MFETLMFYYLALLNILMIVILILLCTTITLLGYLILFIFYTLICFLILYNMKVVIFGIILCIVELHVAAILFFFVFCWLNLNTLSVDYLTSLYRLKTLRYVFIYILFSCLCIFYCFSFSTQAYLVNLFYYYDNYICYYIIYTTQNLSTVATLSFYIYNTYCFELYMINFIFLICVFTFYAFYNSIATLRVTLYYKAAARYNKNIIQNSSLFIRKQSQTGQLLRDAATRCTGKYFTLRNSKFIK